MLSEPDDEGALLLRAAEPALLLDSAHGARTVGARVAAAVLPRAVQVVPDARAVLQADLQECRGCSLGVALDVVHAAGNPRAQRGLRLYRLS